MVTESTICIEPSPDGHYILLDEADVHIWKSRSWSFVKNEKGNGDNIYFLSDRKYFHNYLMDIPCGLVCDHINGNNYDFRRSNLRVASCTENSRNAKKLSTKITSSKYKGVTKPTTGKKFIAQIRISGRKNQVRLGCFLLEEDAARAYDEAARKYHGAYACVNFPNAGERGALL